MRFIRVQEFTLQSRDAFPHRHGALAGKLAQGHLQQKDWDPRNAQHGQVGDQKSAWNNEKYNGNMRVCDPFRDVPPTLDHNSNSYEI